MALPARNSPLCFKDGGGASWAPPLARSPKNILDERHYTEWGAIVYVKLYLKLNPVLQHFSQRFSLLKRQKGALLQACDRV